MIKPVPHTLRKRFKYLNTLSNLKMSVDNCLKELLDGNTNSAK